ncbi:MAG: hypothetical protein R2824_09825 [Saprospiraceae bacterium]
MIKLLKKQDGPTERATLEQMKRPVINVLNLKYYRFSAHFKDAYHSAFAENRANILEGKLGLPLRARLFTILATIARYQLHELLRKMRIDREFPKDDEVLFAGLLEQEEGTDSDYMDFLRQINPIVRNLNAENLVDLAKLVLEELEEPYREYLRWRYIEGWSYRKMAEEIIKQGREPVKEATLRRAVFNALQKARELLNVKKKK